jgi:hypothetical protein
VLHHFVNSVCYKAIINIENSNKQKRRTFIWTKYSLALAISPSALACNANDLNRAISSSDLLEVGTGAKTLSYLFD